MTARSFPTPWIVNETTGAFRVEDSAGDPIAWTYFADHPEGSAGPAAMTRDEAHRIAKAIAMIPEMRTIIRTLQEGLTETEGEAET
jgi:hypothetical protein